MWSRGREQGYGVDYRKGGRVWSRAKVGKLWSKGKEEGYVVEERRKGIK